MSLIDASQIYVGIMFITVGLAYTKIGTSWIGFILPIVSIGSHFWFAYVTGLWPFALIGIALVVIYSVGIIITAKEAINASKS